MAIEVVAASPELVLPLALAGKLFILWLLGIPAGLLLLVFLVMKLFVR